MEIKEENKRYKITESGTIYDKLNKIFIRDVKGEPVILDQTIGKVSSIEKNTDFITRASFKPKIHEPTKEPQPFTKEVIVNKDKLNNDIFISLEHRIHKLEKETKYQKRIIDALKERIVDLSDE